MQWSDYQLAVFQETEKGKGNIIVRATAGSGKTTTAVEAIARQKGKRVFLAFNKKIVVAGTKALEKRGLGFPDVQANTVHSLGSRVWRRVAPKAVLNRNKGLHGKQGKICIRLQVPDIHTFFVLAIVDLARLQAFKVLHKIEDTRAWYDIVDHHDLDSHYADEKNNLPPNIDQLIDEGINWAKKVLNESINTAREEIDYTDQVFMPVVSGTYFGWFDEVNVDEIQDTSPLFRCFYRKCMKKGGRLTGYGDENQAINGFAGADNDAMKRMISEFNCKVLPLTISYRCPKAVVNYVKRLCKALGKDIDIESAPNAIEGEVNNIENTAIPYDQFLPSDAMLCRNTAPLVEQAYKMLKMGIPCRIEGKEIGQGLITLIDKWKSPKTLDALLNKLADYKDKQLTRLLAKGKEIEAQNISDKVETILVLSQGLNSIQDLKNKINNLFVDSEDQPVQVFTLCTVHKSKGLEWDNVYWLGRNRYQPSPYARQDWQLDQEINLIFVAGTRAKSKLIDIHVPLPMKQY